MTKNEIIEKWFREGIVQKIVAKYACGSKNPKYDDLISMTYLDLLEKDESLIVSLNETGEYRYYIARMITNNVKSNDSPWRRKYSWFSQLSYELIPNANYKYKGESETVKRLREVLDGLSEDDERICNIVSNAYANGFGRVQNVMEVYGVKRKDAMGMIADTLQRIREKMEC